MITKFKKPCRQVVLLFSDLAFSYCLLCDPTRGSLIINNNILGRATNLNMKKAMLFLGKIQLIYPSNVYAFTRALIKKKRLNLQGKRQRRKQQLGPRKIDLFLQHTKQATNRELLFPILANKKHWVASTSH